jgi:regulator of replication initiation timing
MPEIFSFIKHPVIALLEASMHLIPGVEKCTVLFFNNQLQEIQCKGLQNNEQAMVNSYQLTDVTLAERLRKKRFQFQWMRPDQLPFETINKGQHQLNIFDEAENIVLALAFENEFDKKSDLLFLYLNKNLSSFGISNGNTSLSTSEKSIIGSMAYNSFKMQQQKDKTDREILKNVNTQIKSLQTENELLQTENKHLRDGYSQQIVALCTEHLQNLSEEYMVNFELDKTAIKKLNTFSGSIDQLKTILTQAVQLAINMNFGSSQNNIILKAWDIKLDHVLVSNPVIAVPNIQERYQKTYLLLEKLEQAARTVVNNKDRLTSENVGNACPTPISAPAISDALKNHHKKALHLLSENPDRWPTIRNEFRPVKNLLNNQQAV